MKIRNGFVSNSSSSSFLITNTSDKKLSLVDFVVENQQLINEFIERYDYYEDSNYNQDNLVVSAASRNIVFFPNIEQCCSFGDDDGNLIGHVFDYILRDGGKSENFKWVFYKSNR